EVEVAGPSPTRVAGWGAAGANRDEARAYVQGRLALFSKLWFWLFWVLVAVLEATYRLFPEMRPARVGFVVECALVGQALFAAIWYFALHKRRVSLVWLYRIDAFYLIVIGVELGNSVYMQSDLAASMYIALVWHTMVVFARVVMLPSTGMRTLIVPSLAFVPLLVGGDLILVYHPERVGLPPLVFVVGAIFLAGLAVLLATAGSIVIYGLRRQVREAMQLGHYTLEEKIGEGGMGAVY